MAFETDAAVGAVEDDEAEDAAGATSEISNESELASEAAVECDATGVADVLDAESAEEGAS